MTQTETTLRRVAQGIVARRLETPALLFLELHLPLATVAHTATVFAAPMVAPLFGAERIATLQEILSERANLERLMELIHHGVQTRDKVTAS